jgi:hypothetical protein
MSDLNDLNRPLTTDTEPNVLDTLRAHIVRAATWTGWGSTANKVAGLMSAVTAAVSGGRSLRLYRRNDANTADEEVVSLPGISVGGNAATASAAQGGSSLRGELDAKAALNSPAFTGTPTAPTAAAGTANTQLASTAFVATAVANVVDSSPAALDTLNELAAALGNDPNFAASTATALGNRVVRQSANRPGVTRLYRRDDDSAYSVQTHWTGARWRLAGYFIDDPHVGVEVEYADTAGSAATAGHASTAGSATTAGNASTVTTVTTAQVLGATAGATAGGVGTYVFGRIVRNFGVGAFIAESDYPPPNVSGSNIYMGRSESTLEFIANSSVQSGTFASSTWASSLPGTWRFVAGTSHRIESFAGTQQIFSIGLWLRIA